MKNHFLFRVSIMSAIILVIALLVAAPLSAVRAQQSIQQRAPRIEVTRLDHAASPDDPEAIYQGARVVYNVTVDGQKGMRIHAHFTVKYAEGVRCRLIAYFFFDDGEPPTALDSANPKYTTDKGKVSADTFFTPAYDPAEYKDLQIFIPYSALNMERGDDYDLQFYLALYDTEGKRFFGKSGWYKFHMTLP